MEDSQITRVDPPNGPSSGPTPERRPVPSCRTYKWIVDDDRIKY